MAAKNIYVGNLAFDVTGDDLRTLFETYGEVTKSSVANDRETGRSKGFGFVEMGDGGDNAITSLDGAALKGRNIKVNEAKPREQRSGTGARFNGGSR